jgi:hypothetical protein
LPTAFKRQTDRLRAVFLFAVPEITGSAGIQLNDRVSLRRANEILSSPQSCWIWPTPPRRPCFLAIGDRCLPWRRRARPNAILLAAELSLLLRGNYTFVPGSEPRISIYGGRNVVLAPVHRGWVHFIAINFRTRRAAARKCLRLFVWSTSPALSPPSLAK